MYILLDVLQDDVTIWRSLTAVLMVKDHSVFQWARSVMAITTVDVLRMSLRWSAIVQSASELTRWSCFQVNFMQSPSGFSWENLRRNCLQRSTEWAFIELEDFTTFHMFPCSFVFIDMRDSCNLWLYSNLMFWYSRVHHLPYHLLVILAVL